MLWTYYGHLTNILQPSYEHLMKNLQTFYKTYYGHFTKHIMDILQTSYDQHLRNIWIFMNFWQSYKHLTNVSQTSYKKVINILWTSYEHFTCILWTTNEQHINIYKLLNILQTSRFYQHLTNILLTSYKHLTNLLYMITNKLQLMIYTSMEHSLLLLKLLVLALNSLDTLSDVRIKAFTLLF